MKKGSVLPLVLGLAIFLAAATGAFAQGKSIAIPKGTKIEKLAPDSFKLTTPQGYVFTVRSYKKTGKAQGGPGEVGILGDCGIRDAKGLLIATGANAVLRSSPSGLVAGKALKDVPAGDYVKIDDEVTWLPALIVFPSMRIFDRMELLKLNPQPEPPLPKR